MLESLSKGKTRILTSPYIYAKYGILVVFTTRLGGVSIGNFESLNLSFKVGDKPDNVTKNRTIVASSIGVYPERWVLPEQIHGLRISPVYDSDAGRGGVYGNLPVPGSDGLITDCSKLALVVLVADCVPILLFDPETRSIGAVHAGWRGVLGGVAIEAVRKMKEFYGCAPSKIFAFLGPHIRSCCFQLDYDKAKHFENDVEQSVVEKRKGSNYFVSLEKALFNQLEFQGLKRDKIYTADICTCCDNGYFSFRGNGGITGRQAGIISSF